MLCKPPSKPLLSIHRSSSKNICVVSAVFEERQSQKRSFYSYVHTLHSYNLTFSLSKYTYILNTTESVPSSELGPLQPLSRERVCPPPEPKGGHTRMRVRGWGVPIRMTGEKAKHPVYSVHHPFISLLMLLQSQIVIFESLFKTTSLFHA